jgi:SNF2 family DNA or RNA helicase
MQNCLGDFGSLLAFIGVPPFVTHEQFKFWLASPLLSKQQNSLQTLRKLVQATCLRRTKAHPHLASTLKLPAKTERVESVDLSPDERRLYDFFRRKFHLLANSPGTSSDAPDAGTTKRGGRKRAARIEAVPAVHEPRRKNSRHIIIVISLLRRICDHGEALLSPGALDIWHQRGSSAVTWDMLQQDAYEGIGRSCCVCGQQMVGDNGEEGVEIEMAMVELMCEKHVACEGCVALADSEALKCPTCATITEPPSAGSAGSNVETSVYRPSAKVSALLRKILPTLGSDGVAPIKRCVCSSRVHACGRSTEAPHSVQIIKQLPLTSGPCSVIFSQWTGMLDLVSRALAPHLSSLGLSCARLDGRSSLQQRRDILDRFNSDERCVIMLATIGAVGEGYVLISPVCSFAVSTYPGLMLSTQRVLWLAPVISNSMLPSLVISLLQV